MVFGWELVGWCWMGVSWMVFGWELVGWCLERCKLAEVWL